MVDKTDFGVALAEMRQKRGLAQRDLSALAGMPDSAIGQYESGHRP
ncbi:helix-turn-helix domain-containing protein, partial [Klebsiella pneumoniae]